MFTSIYLIHCRKENVKESYKAGWYKDPYDNQVLRFWNGTEWTHHMSYPPNRKLDFADEMKYTTEINSNNLQKLQLEIRLAQDKLNELRQSIKSQSDYLVLEDLGVLSDDRSILSDSSKYKKELEKVKTRKRQLVTEKLAYECDTQWTLSGSINDGKKMADKIGKLALTAYNGRIDDIISAVRYKDVKYYFDKADKVQESIEKLSDIVHVSISEEYHILRKKEIQLTWYYKLALAEEKERQKEERIQLREAKKFEAEIAKKKLSLEQEREKILMSISLAKEQGNEESISKFESSKEEIDKELEKVAHREANKKAGYVYVISNIGSFGENIVKIGMTRRIDPMDRIKELGDASVPFSFDVHAIFYSDNAADIEAQAHAYFNDKRVNKINGRKEYFYVTPNEVKNYMDSINVDMVTFTERSEAYEYNAGLKNI